MNTDTEPVTGDRTDTVVTRIIAEQLGQPLEAVKPEAKLVTDLKADELDHIELAMAIEDEFMFMVDDGDENWSTVADVISYVNRKLHALAASKAHGVAA